MQQPNLHQRIILVLALLGGSIAALVGILSLLTPPASAQIPGGGSPDGVWGEATLTPAAAETASSFVAPPRLLSLSLPALAGKLAGAPAEFGATTTALYLPLPDGRYELFHITTTPLLAPALAAKYPQIRTYMGQSAVDPTRTARLDWTPQGFHGMILGGGDGRVFIDPVDNEENLYISYFTADYKANLPEDFFQHADFEPGGMAIDNHPHSPHSTPLSGAQLRTYRLAMAATADYTAYHDDGNPGNGDDVADALSAIVTTMNRVTGIYERDVAIRFELVADNEQIIFSGTDPYTDLADGIDSFDLDQNQFVIDGEIGSANYDIGHLLHDGGGGLAGLGVVCNNLWKARGATGLPTPEGDPFDVDYVAHEIGHQFNAHHTFNSNAGICADQRNSATAFEPGSGSTIMAYAGVCPGQNLQSNSDAYFHGASIVEIHTFVTSGGGADCGTPADTGNTPPEVNAGAVFTIPVSTPFVLTGSATDTEQVSLTYGWEQVDSESFGLPPDFSLGNSPIFRSFTPVTGSARIFPQIDDLVNNTTTIGEMLPTYDRTLHFRLTVRDGVGGTAYDETAVAVTASAGPFRVTAPNTSVTWLAGGSETITWDVANTDGTPVNCTAVDILLSIDRGYTYPYTLRSNIPNDGTETIIVPALDTSSARVQVRCADNIFFDISDVDFTIEGSTENALLLPAAVPSSFDLTTPDQLTYRITISNSGGVAASATITDIFPAPLTNPVCNGQTGNLQETVTIPAAAAAGYTCTLTAANLLQMSLSVDQPNVVAGESVTYTAVITNSSTAIDLAELAVSLPGVANCTPALDSVNSLAAGQVLTFSCPHNEITSSITVDGSVSAQKTISNSVTAVAPEDPRGAQTSPPAETILRYTAGDTAVVISDDWFLYLPFLPRPAIP
jgi:hypothetical protein